MWYTYLLTLWWFSDIVHGQSLAQGLEHSKSSTEKWTEMMILATNPRISPLLPHTCYLTLHVSTGTASYMHHLQTGRQAQRGRFHADG